MWYSLKYPYLLVTLKPNQSCSIHYSVVWAYGEEKMSPETAVLLMGLPCLKMLLAFRGVTSLKAYFQIQVFYETVMEKKKKKHFCFMYGTRTFSLLSLCYMAMFASTSKVYCHSVQHLNQYQKTKHISLHNQVYLVLWKVTLSGNNFQIMSDLWADLKLFFPVPSLLFSSF